MLYAPIPAPEPMHVPDGFLSVTVSILMWILSIAVIAIALRKTNQSLGEREVPLMGVLAAAIFAGQMLNFTVAGGTSGHLLGAALATILLGPWPAVLVMTTVVSVQALLFQDGGILALGANIFNMSVIGVFVSYAVYTLLSRLLKNKRWGLYVSGFSAAWASIFVAALAVALQLALSGTSPANLAIPAMALIHALIGVGEGLITAGALAFLYAARKDLFNTSLTTAPGSRGILMGGILIALLLAVLSPLASSNPDGLERVAEDFGFIELAQSSLFNIIPDYEMPGISNPVFATIAAGVVGVLIVFGVTLGLARTEKR
jgi:cobalt/nickel transport system permease protein